MKILIKNGRVIDPENKVNQVMDILIEDDKIAKLAEDIKLDDAEAIIIEAQNKIVCPGFIDLHVHLREPGFEYKEEIATGTRAAAVGGFTSICCMPNTDPVIDNAAVANFIKERAAKSGVVNVFSIGAISKEQLGAEITEIAQLVAAGCVAISDDGEPVTRANIMRNAMDYAKMFNIPVLLHCEEVSLSQGGQMHEGYYSTYYGLKGIPAAAEEIMIARDILLSKITGAHIHICHISTKGSVELIRKAKEEGVNITCEVTPHHLTLTDEIVGTYDTDTKVYPPLRSQEDLDALIIGLNDGVIDCIATDHAPHDFEAKDCEYELAEPGISGLETAIPVVMSLVKDNQISIEKMVSLFTINPAQIMQLDRGNIGVGSIADLTIIDPNLEKVVNPDEFYSKGKNTPFKGQNYTGWPVLTIINGKIIANDGKIVNE
ncbi:MAG TPA: dihydroorotase [Syntrophomonadaceae bacterium]|nr:dihydroorotase [Syntrophomonadaceae bacterium]